MIDGNENVNSEVTVNAYETLSECTGGFMFLLQIRGRCGFCIRGDCDKQQRQRVVSGNLEWKLEKSNKGQLKADW